MKSRDYIAVLNQVLLWSFPLNSLKSLFASILLSKTLKELQMRTLQFNLWSVYLTVFSCINNFTFKNRLDSSSSHDRITGGKITLLL